MAHKGTLHLIVGGHVLSSGKRELMACAVIELRRAGWSIRSIAAVLGVSRRTAYRWAKYYDAAAASAKERDSRRPHGRRRGRLGTG